jgi:two-component system sensor histidine kinase KdpD
MPSTRSQPRPAEIPAGSTTSPWARADGGLRDSRVAFVAAAAGLAATTLLGVVGFDYVTIADLAMLYLVAIMLAALVGRGLVLVAVPLAVLTLNFVFMPPHFALGITDAHTLATLSIMLGAGMAISALTTVLRRNERNARDGERRTAAMLAFTRDVAAAADIPGIAGVAVHHVEDLLGAVAVVLVHADDRLTPAAGSLALTAQELDVARWCLEHGLPAGHGTTTLPRTAVTALPLRAADETHGVLVVSGIGRARGLDVEQRHLIDALARQAGFAIGRARLAVQARDATVRARTEELRSSLLSAVSHDLRTPLAVITGAATSLRDDAARIPLAGRAELLDTIVHEAGRLERVLQNLLGITRVETGLQPAREWVPVEELCGTALGRLAAILGDRLVTVDVPGDLLVPVDPVLFDHVLINLLENAVKHGAPPIEIAARAVGDRVELSVRDHGGGLPPDCTTHVFEKFFRAPGTRVPGVGLGLAVCRGIVEAHGGTITADTAPGGGARFVVLLPAADAPTLSQAEDA